jgi:ADP-glucose pyrophosphorylase
MYHNRVLAMVLAGGQGKRLLPLTKDRAKPAVPFGGRYRIIDFVLNNFVNSGFHKIKVLTQYKSDSLNKHISRGWNLCSSIDQYVDLVPAQMRTDGNWYKGTADAIYQNMNQITDESFSHICVFGGDHIYKMDVRQMLNYHNEKQADLTISAIAIPIELASEYGVIEVDDNWRLTGFIEKPQTAPKHIPGDPTKCLVSMGNYIFNPEKLVKELKEESKSISDINKERLVRELANMAFSSIADMQNTWIDRKEFDSLTPGQKSSIKSISTKIVKKNVGSKDDPEFVDVEFVKIELYDKIKAIEVLNKMLGYNEAEKHEHQFKEPMTDAQAKTIIETLGI